MENNAKENVWIVVLYILGFPENPELKKKVLMKTMSMIQILDDDVDTNHYFSLFSSLKKDVKDIVLQIC